MRALLLMPLFLLCTGCKAEPDFDARYAGAEKRLRAKEQAIDAELAKRAGSAPAAEPSSAADNR